MKEQDIKHLEWIFNRLKNIHNENENIDYMIKFHKIINEIKKVNNEPDIIVSFPLSNDGSNIGIKTVFNTNKKGGF